ncbi:caspase family protein [Tolypothrix sp. LEGE 11397]|uniref:caspase family protein n=1 Tax=unclassified Tolypothrix TaxID=2649714 RepID=UPI000B621A98|nr:MULTISPECIES: caspase family protein [unclassified Tolypothrix]MBE9086065.1 caspase family protein [Tolypothrix sp. LEGE 11397]UYD27504.1 caspase family protein [Tolypothrix sp. PCC 7712]UYD36633.1 caspase family protein [Tolypothrix sp. PCC 7601]BAY93686.1 peptidase C14 caspase catalytic subunit p20 [Microchaete diplosiphon NIES-3275]
MSYIKRRQFIQFAGSALATMGISQLDIMRQGERYAKVLAQDTPRKLALLVGINDYKNSIPTLGGCLTDVSLQKELLTNRFGFNEKNILTLTDSQATRQGILQAFDEHLIKQAKPGDVVIFHFSGHGSRVKDEDMPGGLNGTIVPVDSSFLPNGGVVQDIMGGTLFLLMYALQTTNVTVVLDCCYSGGTKRGNFAVRSRDGGSNFLPSKEEYETQRKLLERIPLSQQDFITKRRQNVAKGIVITSAKPDQFAVDGQFSDFRAGAFTYALTQYLWQVNSNEAFAKTFAYVRHNARTIAWNTGGFQEAEIERNIKNLNSPLYFLPPKATPAEAVITGVNGNQVNLWLGGIEPQSLESFNKSATLTVIDEKGEARGHVQIESRQGLFAKGKLLNNTRTQTALAKGTLLQERIRTIPKDITLKIGLDDSSLDSNIIAQAKQALQTIPGIEALALRQQEVQYIFGRMTQAKYQELQKQKIPNLPAVGSFGLFTPTLDAIIVNSFDDAGETLNAAVQRLKSTLKSFWAARVVKNIIGNKNTSKINISVSMIVADSQEPLANTFTPRGAKTNNDNGNQSAPSKPVSISDSGIPKLPLDTTIAFQVHNQESVPLYVTILGIDSAGEIANLFPYDWSEEPILAASIAGGDKVLIPKAEHQRSGTRINIGKPLGFSEILIIASPTPLRDLLEKLQAIADAQGQAGKRSLITATGDEFLDLTNNLLDDLDRSTRGGIIVENIQLPEGERGVDTTKLAVMSIPFEVVS